MKKKLKKLVLFDIDGTILKPGTNLGLFEHVCEVVYGIKSPQIVWSKTTHVGSIDRKILVDMLIGFGLEEPAIIAKIPQAFEVMHAHFVRVVTPEFKNAVIKEAATLIKKLQNKVYLGILSGRAEKVGWEILKQFNLDTYFLFGVFGHEAENRLEMTKLIPPRIKKHFGFSLKPQNIIIIGDTPHDITCARAIGARVIAVATGRYTLDELADYKSDLTVATLADPRVRAFIQK
jgi:phosphoglycolate phosphatase-like HAD superfamily hydrolase